MNAQRRDRLQRMWGEWVTLQAERGRAAARKRLTSLLCAGSTMREALATISAEDVSIGIHAAAVAEEERGYSP